MTRDLPIIQSHRGTHVVQDGRELVVFAGTDYLGLARDPRVLEALVEGTKRFGLSCSASRITSGNAAPHVELEEALARFLGVEAVALTSAGYLAASAVIDVLAGTDLTFHVDAEAHSSLWHALAGARDVRPYPHRDVSELGGRLQPEAGVRVLVSDSVFGLRGELAPLEELLQLAQAKGASLLIDDSHALGVLGEEGRGTFDALPFPADSVVVGTISKALGSHGGYVAGSAACIAEIRSRSRTYLGATPPPPALCLAAARALSLLREERRVARLRSRTSLMRRELLAAGLPVHGHEDLPIFWLGAEDGVAPAELHERLKERGFLVPCSRYPGAPAGGLLRWTLQATHEDESIVHLAATLAELVGDRSS